MEQLRSIAQSKDVEAAHLVLAWYLTQPSIDALTLNVELTVEEIAVVDQIFR